MKRRDLLKWLSAAPLLSLISDKTTFKTGRAEYQTTAPFNQNNLDLVIPPRSHIRLHPSLFELKGDVTWFVSFFYRITPIYTPKVSIEKVEGRQIIKEDHNIKGGYCIALVNELEDEVNYIYENTLTSGSAKQPSQSHYYYSRLPKDVTLKPYMYNNTEYPLKVTDLYISVKKT